MITRNKLIACAMLPLLATACGPYLEKPSVQQALVEDLVVQVQLALSAIAARYNLEEGIEDSQLSLELTKAEVKVSTAIQISQTGQATLVVAASGERANTAANYMLLTLFAPNSDQAGLQLSSTSEKTITNAQSLYFSSALEKISAAPRTLSSLSDLDCDSPADTMIGDPKNNTEFWEDLAALTKAAADGYLCAALAAEKRPVRLNKLEVNVAFTAVHDDKNGLKFKIWNIEVGASRSSKSTTGNSITMYFCALDCDKTDAEGG